MANLEDVLTEIALEGSREMEPMPGHQMPASDQSHHEQYPLLSILLPVYSHYYKTTKLSSL